MNPRNRYDFIRCILEVPILIEKFWAKVPDLTSDAIMVDLEDSAPPANKAQARRRVIEALDNPSIFGGKQILVRVNNLDTEWGLGDLEALSEHSADFVVCYPKVTSVREMEQVVHLVRTARADRGVWAMIETPRAVVELNAIARVNGVVGLHFGYTDYALELGIAPFDSSGGELSHALRHVRNEVSIAAAAYGLFATGGSLIPDYRISTKVESFVRGWKEAGYTGCVALSPSHLPLIARIFSSTREEIEAARETCVAFEEARAADAPNAVVDGRVVTLPEYRRLQAILNRAATPV